MKKTLCGLKGVFRSQEKCLDSVHSADDLDFSDDEESNYSPDEENLDTTGDEDIGERQGE